MKISGQTLSSTTFSQAGGSPQILRPDAGALGQILFGKNPAKLVDKRKYPSLRKALKKLGLSMEQIAEATGLPDEAFTLELAEGNNASINRDGQIAFGVDLLSEHEDNDDLLLGILGHEMGHAPWSWPEGDLGPLTQAQINHLCREEEAKADRFMGKALAELGMSPDAICDFLVRLSKFETHPPADYYPAEERAELIRSTFSARKRVLNNVKHLSPRVLQRMRELR